MTIREKFADLKFLMSQYKDSHMVVLFIGIQRILNITESISSVKKRERGRSVTFKTWVRFPSAPPRNYEQYIR